MANYSRPGVYVNELPLAAAPVNGAAAATAAGAVIGAFAQGPDDVTLVTSWYQFTKLFGGYNKAYPASFQVGSFFRNGGTELYVKRVLPASARRVAKVSVPAFAEPVTSALSKYSIVDQTVTLTTVSSHNIAANDQRITVSGTGVSWLNNSFTISSKTSNEVVFALPDSADIEKALASYSVTDGTATVTTAASHGAVIGNKVTISSASVSRLNGTFTVTGKTDTTVSFAVTPDDGDPVSTTSVTGTLIVSEAEVGGNLSYSNSPNNAFVTFAAKHRGVDGNNIRVVLSKSASIREAGYYDVTVLYEAGRADSVQNGVVTAGGEDDVVVERFSGVVFDDKLSGDYIVSVLEFNSAYIRVLEGPVSEYDSEGNLIEVGDPDYIASYTVGTYPTNANTQTPVTDVIFPLSGAPSPEVNLTYADYTGNTQYDPAGNGSGSFSVDDCLLFTEFETINRPLVFFLPDVSTKIATESSLDTGTYGGWNLAKYVYNALISWAETEKTSGLHFVVVETAAGVTVDGALSASGDITPESSRAAVYYPHIYIKDPVGRSGQAVRQIGPSGAVVGTFLKTDATVGPFKAPAGIQASLSDAIALERAFSPSDLDALNTGVSETGVLTGRNVVNAIRNMPGAGIVIMGGRTLKQDGTANRYINMRRSLTYLEKRLADLASFAVFENNDEKLWARLITVLGAFLNEYRNQGGLRGTTVDQAFYVKCDNETNSPAAIAAGEVHVEIGVALEYPAEFVTINLSQKTAE